ncbi:Organic hydroperoxide resistance transcriptional regulator [Eubacteriaceae bacterium CHKCI005]|uniref:HTH-type transcriptional regulator SarZ n=1 Tax=Solibaculum mannosilyticum TaxID=2780922 RepID=A0A7I8D808_9FIRM|nr:MarR family transcriptional regulator [Solibaculum mannosilyticum]BCI60764.1 hypothetical protein C12CBH8_14030 [Solibaculum mannosilyticum]CZT57540.1 Organic hydroperoxide resistance transcriptional regulator [Eubacteriaceae bacterium CHKCI005]
MDFKEFKYYLWDSLRDINEQLDRVFEPACKQYNLTMIQAQILLKIDHFGPLRVGSLGKSINIAGGNISSLCKKMEKQGLLLRYRDTEDERAVNIALTKYGQSVVDGISIILREQYSAMMSSHPQEDLDCIVEGLKRLNVLLHKLNSSPALY